MKPFLIEFNLIHKILVHVKDKGKNLATFVIGLFNVVSCTTLNLQIPYARTCFGHTMSKVCEYVMVDNKACANMEEIFFKTCISIFAKNHQLDQEV
jgi:hypothetical protein